MFFWRPGLGSASVSQQISARLRDTKRTEAYWRRNTPNWWEMFFCSPGAMFTSAVWT